MNYFQQEKEAFYIHKHTEEHKSIKKLNNKIVGCIKELIHRKVYIHRRVWENLLFLFDLFQEIIQGKVLVKIKQALNKEKMQQKINKNKKIYK